MPECTLDYIAELEEQLETAKRVYLRNSGWEETCDTPGAIWLWRKTLPDGRLVLVTEPAALHMQEVLQNLAALDEVHDEDDEEED